MPKVNQIIITSLALLGSIGLILLMADLFRVVPQTQTTVSSSLLTGGLSGSSQTNVCPLHSLPSREILEEVGYNWFGPQVAHASEALGDETYYKNLQWTPQQIKDYVAKAQGFRYVNTRSKYDKNGETVFDKNGDVVKELKLPVAYTKPLSDLNDIQIASLQFTPEEMAFLPSISPPLNTDEYGYFVATNIERVGRGLNRLTLDPLLIQVSRHHSQDMGVLDYFDHIVPTKSTEAKDPVERYAKAYLQKFGKQADEGVCVGENLYSLNNTKNENLILRGQSALMRSFGHRENELFGIEDLSKPGFVAIGVGSYVDSNGQFFMTKMFTSSKGTNKP